MQPIRTRSHREAGTVDRDRLEQFVNGVWDDTIVPSITDYIKIPNKSPLYDASWRTAGHMDKAIKLIETWCRAQDVEGISIEVVRLEGRTPLLVQHGRQCRSRNRRCPCER
jgi:hypothetical protein